MKNMKILFLIRSLKHFSYVSSIINALYDAGCHIDLRFDKDWSKTCSSGNVYKFIKGKEITVDWFKKRTKSKSILLFREFLSCVNYVRIKGQSAFYRKRWFSYIPFYLRPLAYLFKPFYKHLCKVENRISPDKGIIEDITKLNPDYVIATPANHRFSGEIEYIKAAKYLGIKTVIISLSWDNLTTKGMFHVKPDKLFVWNDTQKNEAFYFQNIQEQNISIIGAPFFDKWLLPTMTEPRFEFCNRVGLNPFKSFMLYLGSSANIIDDETWLIKELSLLFPEVEILVRPHPSNYKNYTWLSLKNVSVFPKDGSLPDDHASKADFYNSIKYCVFAFGVNTSAMIDAIIHYRPCLTLIDERFKETQVEANHFSDLSKFLIVCNSFEEIKDHANKIMLNKKKVEDKRNEFVKKFIWPVKNYSAGRYMVDFLLDKTNKGELEDVKKTG